jgi:fructose-1,6-bisphosphatase/inositol monophosphatase family enzyme
LIVAESGGRVTHMDGTPFNSHRRHVLATNALLHEPMLEIIRNFKDSQAVD